MYPLPRALARRRLIPGRPVPPPRARPHMAIRVRDWVAGGVPPMQRQRKRLRRSGPLLVHMILEKLVVEGEAPASRAMGPGTIPHPELKIDLRILRLRPDLIDSSRASTSTALPPRCSDLAGDREHDHPRVVRGDMRSQPASLAERRHSLIEDDTARFLPCCYGNATTIRRAQGASLEQGCSIGHGVFGQWAAPAVAPGARYVGAAVSKSHAVLVRDDGEPVAFVIATWCGAHCGRMVHSVA